MAELGKGSFKWEEFKLEATPEPIIIGRRVRRAAVQNSLGPGKPAVFLAPPFLSTSTSKLYSKANRSGDNDLQD